MKKYLLPKTGNFYKANLHAHTDMSDGRNTPEEVKEIFKSKGYTVVCADENTDNILGECQLKLPILLIVGGEKRGISKAVIDSADILVKIGYDREFRASLSAASATTMFSYEISRQNKK